MTRYIRNTLGLFTLLALTQGCSSSPEADPSVGSNGSGCDAVCAITNDASSSLQTNYWRIQGLGCGGASGCYAVVSLYGDGLGEINWGGTRTAYCPAGTSLNPSAFTYTKSSANSILITGTGIPIQCSSNINPTESVLGISNIVTVAEGVFDADFNFGSAMINYHGDRVSGTF